MPNTTGLTDTEALEMIKEVNQQPLCEPKEYKGVMKLNYRNGLGAWDDVVHTLIAHGYEVTTRKADKESIEIEYRQV